jgi:kinetochor protein Mis14/NSL1
MKVCWIMEESQQSHAYNCYLEFEPLDTRLAERIRALEATKESLTEKVADLRRTAPAQATQDFQVRWMKDNDHFDSNMKQEDNDVVPYRGIDIGELKRWEEIQTTWERGTQGLVALKSSLTETVARLERAKNVVEHMEGK